MENLKRKSNCIAENNSLLIETSVLNPDELEVLWRLKNYTLLSSGKDDRITSPDFSTERNKNIKWDLRLYPKGHGEGSEGFISLYLHYSNNTSDDVVNVNCDFALLDENNKRVNTNTNCCTFKNRESFGFIKFLEIRELIKNKKEWLENDELTLSCSIKFSLSNVISECKPKSNLKEMKNESSMNHFESLFKKGTYSDVILFVAEEQFKVHKVILAAISPVFAAMFEHNMTEKVTNEVYIQDFSSNAVQEMLRFIYTGKVENFDNLVEELIAIADKYEVCELKDLCENFICNSLSPENVLKFLSMSVMYRARELEYKCKNYIIINREEIVNTEEFLELKSSNPTLIADLFVSMVKDYDFVPVSKKQKLN